MDYTLSTTSQRLQWIEQNLSQISNLEKAADYLLFFSTKPTPQKEQNATPLPEEISQYSPPSYTSPRQTIDWTFPELIPLLHAKNQLAQLCQKHENSPSHWKYKKWKTELSLEATPILNAYRPQITPRPKFHQPNELDISQYIDYTNTFHIKHIIAHYSKLRQSQSQLEMDYFDTIIEATPLKDWEKHILVRKIDGAKADIIGFELAENYSKFISSTYLSNTLRAIYKKIAKTAAQLEQEWKDRNNPAKWKYCPGCNKTLHQAYWYEKKKYCKICEKNRLAKAKEKSE